MTQEPKFKPDLGQSSKVEMKKIRKYLEEIGFSKYGTGRHGAVSDADVVRYCITNFLTIVEAVIFAERNEPIIDFSISDFEDSIDEMVESWTDAIEGSLETYNSPVAAPINNINETPNDHISSLDLIEKGIIPSTKEHYVECIICEDRSTGYMVFGSDVVPVCPDHADAKFISPELLKWWMDAFYDDWEIADEEA